jgi:glycosyltransferase involved in cell wall biosynthesis
MNSSSQMSILLVNDHLSGGIGRYVRSLYAELRLLYSARRSVHLLLQNVPRHAAAKAWSNGDGNEITIQRRPWWEKQSGYGTLYQLASRYYYPRRIPCGYALYHVTSQMMGQSVRHVGPAVVTVHDLVALRYPGNHPWLSTQIRARHISALQRAAAIIFPSEFSRQDFLTRFPYPAQHAFVIPWGTGDPFRPANRSNARAALGVSPNRPLLLHVGSEEPRKNVETLLRALPLVAARVPEVLLIRVGARSHRASRLIRRLKLERHVHYEHDVSDEGLALWYAAADALVFPSLLEGFGLPLLEALRCGCPVVAANTSSIPEVTGDAAVLVDDPLDPAELAAAIARVLEDTELREQLRQRGLSRAAGFSWPLAAERTAAVYEHVLAGA